MHNFSNLFDKVLKWSR